MQEGKPEKVWEGRLLVVLGTDSEWNLRMGYPSLRCKAHNMSPLLLNILPSLLQWDTVDSVTPSSGGTQPRPLAFLSRTSVWVRGRWAFNNLSAFLVSFSPDFLPPPFSFRKPKPLSPPLLSSFALSTCLFRPV